MPSRKQHRKPSRPTNSPPGEHVEIDALGQLRLAAAITPLPGIGHRPVANAVIFRERLTLPFHHDRVAKG